MEGSLKNAYLHDVSVAQEYAALNRRIILREILKGMKWKESECIESVHNYIDVLSDGRKILRKGAISAREGQPVVIPVSMRDGVIIGFGKNNMDWNESAPHGSGRKYKREDVKNNFTVSAFKAEMKGIYSTCIGAGTLDAFVITGHTPTQTIEDNPRPGFIYRKNNHIAIDCGAHYPGGRLAAICLETGEEFYSSMNEMGVSVIC